MPRPMRWPVAVKPTPGTMTMSMNSTGIGVPAMGSRTGPVREPIAGTPMPVDLIDMVIVPGVGFTPAGQRIGRGMGFYDRFLAQPEFIGVSCGLAFEEQIVAALPTLDHDMSLSMLASDRGVRRFASHCIGQK